MRRAARVDRNHASVLQAAADVGAQIVDTHALPGCLDALVAFRGRLHLVEIKMPSERNALTPKERETISRLTLAGCPPLVVTTADELLCAIGAMR